MPKLTKEQKYKEIARRMEETFPGQAGALRRMIPAVAKGFNKEFPMNEPPDEKVDPAELNDKHL